MKISVEDKKQEAISRMKKLGIYKPTVEQFRRSGKVSVSEPPFGGLYWVTEEEAKAIKEFEEAHNALVYLVVRAFTDFGLLDSYLFVGDNKEDWEYDNADLKEGYAFSYTVNHNAPDCSEFGSICVRKTAGAGLLRVA